MDLGCNATVGQCKWRLTTHVWIADGTLTGYSLWIRDPAGAATQLSLSETSVVGSPFTNHVLPPVENRPDGVLSSLIVGLPQGGSPIPAGPTIYNLHSYVLTTQAGIAPGTLTQLRAGSEGFGGFEPGVQPPFNNRRAVAFGANPGFQIFGGEWPNPVIHINYVPEPATAALLLAPAVMLRRRRPRDRSHQRDQRRRA
ncbi:MAG: hypothetical protein HBSAPP02_00960 [Phycisphaerae bacterium]|nr:MAG: hypothetical protein HBSAPP02_00960 [Phycisphaerae bacterium]